MIRKRYAVLFIMVFVVVLALSRLYTTPILMYHHIDYRWREWKLSVSPESFYRQMEFLKAHRYNVLSLSEYLRLIKEKKAVPKKSVVITFDDGLDNNFLYAYPVLKKMDFPASIFVQLNGIGRSGYLTKDDIIILSQGGIEIGSHTLNHAFLPHLPKEEARNEIFESKKELEKIIGKPINLFSYPGGGWNEETARWVKEAGYEGAVATNSASYFHTNPYALRRVRISRTADDLFVFWIKCSGFYHLIEGIRG